MKQCYRCGTVWKADRAQPRTREYCESCGAYLHTCLNCSHFDREVSSACKLRGTAYVGPRESPNYCEEFRMFDPVVVACEERKDRARATWERLFKS